MKSYEQRGFAGIELRDDGTNLPRIEGYAAVFNVRSVNLGGFVETIAPGAFRSTLKDGADVRAMLDHDTGKVIGRNKAGTLDIAEDNHGLRVSISPPDTQLGRDIVTSIRRGDLDAMSFGFRAIADDWDDDQTPPLRELREVELFDVSVVAFPAYPDTTVAVRSLQRHMQSVGLANEDIRRRIRLIEMASEVE